ncbi:hypothetical protein EQG41_12430 [Billgrantia azerbaijanica]|nr:hypothetical protein EQG41_12430 [Halomonas azerbaijanica]
MATIRKRRKKDGSFSYIAQVRIARDGLQHAESKAFPRKAMAEEWAKRLELESPGNTSRRVVAESERWSALAKVYSRRCQRQ